MIYLILVLSLILNLALVFAVYNLVTKAETYEDFIMELDLDIAATLKNMRDIDIRGAFESDDDVGQVFRRLRAMIEKLDLFLQPAKEDNG
jgi:hypothetical protein